MNKYAGQDRGSLSEYEEYFAGMDASMQQKIALTTAHFPAEGRIADMGSGSGSGTFDLARLYRGLQLFGVDINPVTVEYSNNHFQAANLGYVVGDIAEKVFPDESLDGILDSSVLHHVTSFNNYDAGQITRTLKNQVAQLKPGGVLIIRDFVVPDEAEKLVALDLPVDDGRETGAISELSTAALFEVFARDFRSSLNLKKSVSFKKQPSPRENFARFEVSLRAAAEFVLRKDYRDHWTPELVEEYTYFSQADFERAFRSENLRIVVSMPLWNPWIVENRFVDKFYLSDSRGNPEHFPPTNFLIVGEKVSAESGVRLSEQSAAAGNSAASDLVEAPPAAFLKLKAYRHRQTNQIYELAERPNQTVDLLPWFEDENRQLFVLAKKDFPRPIINAQKNQKHLNRAGYSGYLTEPISALTRRATRDADLSGTAAEDRRLIFDILKKRANLESEEILEISQPRFYFTSPGGIDERVESFLVKIENWRHQAQAIENYTPFTAAGFVRKLDALQILRAAHVGGMFDARLEINIYRLLRALKRSASAWIGASLKPSKQGLPEKFEAAAVAQLAPEKRAAFEPCELTENNFLRLVKSLFVEYDSRGERLAQAEFEYVVPKNLSRNTVSAIPFFQGGDEIFVGVEFRDLPAPQRFSGSSRLACAPAWR
ncbi:MAG TPA: methyltransferase domain-containing protein, partial [Pyrinomonadaceae bacterium]